MHSLRLCTQRTLRSTVLLRTHLFSSRSLSMSTGAQPVSFPVSPPSEHNQPLGPGRFISTAGMIVIGDEVLGGKTVDTNSAYFAKHCFDLGIDLKRIEVIPDDEDEIVEAARRMTKKFDWVVTTGGIGPTHDDITYDALAKAFDLPLIRHEETLKRMAEFSKGRYDFSKQTDEQRTARERMGTLPTGAGAEALFVEGDKWVPVVRLQGKLCVYPGIPTLFTSLLLATTPYLPLPPDSEKPFRRLIETKMPESSIAPFLTKLQTEVRKEGIRVGSYPNWKVGVTVSLIGKHLERLQELEQKVVQELDGKLVKADKLGDAA